MIDVIKVAEIVSGLAQIEENDGYSIMPTVSAACTEISDRLIKAEYSKDDRAVNAAVYLSFYRLLFYRILSQDAQTSFKAGDVTVSQSPSLVLEKAAVLRDEALLTAAPILNDTDFLFIKV